MEIYRIERKLLASDVDVRRRLRLSTLFTMLQEASIAHTEALGAGRDKTLDRGILWVLTMQNLRVFRMPEYDERVTVESWPGPTMHLLFPRYYRLLDGAGKTLAEGSALWVLMDERDRAPVSPQETGVVVPGTRREGQPAFPHAPRSLPTREVGTFTVPYSYADLNGHMNNARYPDLVMDLLPREAWKDDVASVDVEYCGEARLGDSMRILGGSDGTEHYYEGESGGRRIFRLRLSLKKEEPDG